MINIQNRRYLGNKYKLINFIDSTINKHCPGSKTIFDIFAGTGVVAYHFIETKKVITNDTLYSNYLAHIAFMSNENYDADKIKSLIKKYNNVKPQEIADNYMSDNFSNTYFSYEDSKLIGYIREDIEQLKKDDKINNREYAILITILLYGMDKIANTCGHYDAYRKGVAYEKHLKLTNLDLTKQAKFDNDFYNTDSNELIKSEGFPAVDVVYCDPPYNSRNYCDLYHVLENIATWKKPPVEGVARKMDRSALKSKYCSRRAADAFEDLVNNLKCKYIVLSYNNTGTSADDRSNARISDEDIMRILSAKGKVKIYSKKYKAFSTGKSDNQKNEERLFVCEVTQN